MYLRYVLFVFYSQKWLVLCQKNEKEGGGREQGGGLAGRFQLIKEAVLGN